MGLIVKINEKLNLVSTLVTPDGVAYVHASPLPYEVVEENCVLLGSLFSNFLGLVGTIGAPRVAAMMLRQRLARENPEATGPTLLDAMMRTATYIWLTDEGWKTLPLSVALKQGVLPVELWRDVEGELVFFIVNSAIQRANLLKATLKSVLAMYTAQLTSSTATEFRASLPILTTEETTEPVSPAEPEPTSPVQAQDGELDPPPATSFIPS